MPKRKAPRSNLVRWLERSGDPLSFDQWLSYFQYGGIGYMTGINQTLGGDGYEQIPSDFVGYVQAAYKQNGVVFACMLARMLPFSEARFQFRRLRSGRPGEYFGTSQLAILEEPWPNGTTGDLLRRVLQDADLAGNSFTYRESSSSDRLVRMRPDWTTIVLGSRNPAKTDVVQGDLDAEVVGYIYQPGGYASGRKQVNLLRDQVAHFAPIPDPCASFRGMSWLMPVLREIMGDTAATEHKLKFFQQGATPNMVVSLDASIGKDAFDTWVDAMEEEHAGLANAYKTWYLGAGAQASVVGSNLQQMDFKVTQGAGETRIAAAAGVHPVIVGLSEGLQGASLNAGNFQAARRGYADRTLRPLWRDVAASLATLLVVPNGAQLWYDDRDIPFLAEDIKDQAEVMKLNSEAAASFVTAGFDPSSVVDAIVAGDLTRLKHTGLVSVQLAPPGSQNGAQNGSPNGGGQAPTLPAPISQKSLRQQEQERLDVWAAERGLELRP